MGVKTLGFSKMTFCRMIRKHAARRFNGSVIAWRDRYTVLRNSHTEPIGNLSGGGGIEVHSAKNGRCSRGSVHQGAF